MKMEFLIAMANDASKLKYYQISVTVLKKALQVKYTYVYLYIKYDQNKNLLYLVCLERWRCIKRV